MGPLRARARSAGQAQPPAREAALPRVGDRGLNALRVTRFDQLRPTKAERAAFTCGDESLDRWLRQYAGQAIETRDAVTYVLHEDRRILGYYCIAAGSVSRASVTPKVGKRRPPEPVPVILLGRFAIHTDHQGRSLGAQLLRHAVLSAAAAGETIGARALLANALNPRARDFYLKWGFEASPVDDLMVMLHLDDVRSLV